ncbi:hypothetical protein K227x_43800 [Rubripirellula lacrimiformis]|uniref:Uncharacterized protein n=1 Tax=Rubripirellula lacrimiformis TaxID=1930273 RepID=A0A517NFW7_9BACT|nr:hypothetical protein K227x_43800 [Rubripirellula lacrimiformis]
MMGSPRPGVGVSPSQKGEGGWIAAAYNSEFTDEK